jgi:orotate phosphoribosyltransferase
VTASESILGTLRASGALKEGHFVLSSGRHSDQYIEKFDLLRQPRATSDVCRLFADHYRDQDIDVVVGPTTGGVILAFEVARQLGIAAAYAERASNGGSEREFRRGTTFQPGARVLVVDDILTTGGSLLAMIPAVEAAGGEIVECAVMVDRSGGLNALASPTTGRRYSLNALWILDLPTYEPGPATCPHCAAGEPLYAPGSTGATS